MYISLSTVFMNGEKTEEKQVLFCYKKGSNTKLPLIVSKIDSCNFQ